MPKLHLLIDGNNTARRAYHAVGKRMLEQGESYGTTFAFLREVGSLMHKFQTEHAVFCFDVGMPRRCCLLPCYKQKKCTSSSEGGEQELDYELSFRSEVKRLRKELLPAIGFRNVFAEKGYEADDLLARICADLPKGDEAIICSSDKDLYQCLRSGVAQYSPHGYGRLTTAESFRNQYEVWPSQWADVKMICGESPQGDNIPGVPGVGEKTALKFVQGKLPTHHKTYRAILDNKALCQFNHKLVKLPLDGTPSPRLREDRVTREKWNRVVEELGFGEELERYAPPQVMFSRR